MHGSPIGELGFNADTIKSRDFRLNVLLSLEREFVQLTPSGGLGEKVVAKIKEDNHVVISDVGWRIGYFLSVYTPS